MFKVGALEQKYKWQKCLSLCVPLVHVLVENSLIKVTFGDDPPSHPLGVAMTTRLDWEVRYCTYLVMY